MLTKFARIGQKHLKTNQIGSDIALKSRINTFRSTNSTFYTLGRYFQDNSSKLSDFDKDDFLEQFESTKALLNDKKYSTEQNKDEEATSEEFNDEESELLGMNLPTFFHYEILNLDPYDKDIDIKIQFKAISKHLNPSSFNFRQLRTSILTGLNHHSQTKIT